MQSNVRGRHNLMTKIPVLEHLRKNAENLHRTLSKQEEVSLTPERRGNFPLPRNVFPLARNAGEKWRGTMHFNFIAGNRFVWMCSCCIPIFSFWIEFKPSFCISVAVRPRLELLTILLSCAQHFSATFGLKKDLYRSSGKLLYKSNLFTSFYAFQSLPTRYNLSIKVFPPARINHKSNVFYFLGVSISVKWWQ